jgi:hypothetical protein
MMSLAVVPARTRDTCARPNRPGALGARRSFEIAQDRRWFR